MNQSIYSRRILTDTENEISLYASGIKVGGLVMITNQIVGLNERKRYNTVLSVVETEVPLFKTGGEYINGKYTHVPTGKTITHSVVTLSDRVSVSQNEDFKEVTYTINN